MLAEHYNGECRYVTCWRYVSSNVTLHELNVPFDILAGDIVNTK